MPRRRIRAHYEKLSEFERGRIIGLKEGGWANRRITRHMGRSDAVIRRCWQEWVSSGRFQRHDGSGRPRATADQEDRLIVRSAVTALDSLLTTIRRTTSTRVFIMNIHRQTDGWNHADWRRIVLSDESCFQLSPDDRRRRVWRRPGQRASPVFTIACHTGPQQGVMVRGAFSYEAGPLWASLEAHLQQAHRYVDGILRTVLLPFLLKYPGLIFHRDNAKPHTTRVAMNCFTAYKTLLWPARSLSNRACLGYEGKATASTREC
ncbi:HTH_Tnp_Tc3_2 domain-containing protein [Trichonephila clavipes]|nr:HTH_Tnp_Tc3_2 domain-containing protein [Trichonephila clavipes]